MCVCMQNVFGLTSAKSTQHKQPLAKCVIVNDCNQPFKKTQTPNGHVEENTSNLVAKCVIVNDCNQPLHAS